jgi:hypothetical protein
VLEVSRQKQKAVCDAVRLVNRAIALLGDAFDYRRFTIDGRLVGDIAEVLAEMHYDIRLFRQSEHWPPKKFRKGHDGTIGGTKRRVDIKSTFQSKLAFSSIPDFCIGVRMYPDGTHQFVYNGPGKHLRKYLASRVGDGRQSSLSMQQLKLAQREVPFSQRIRRRRDYKCSHCVSAKR